MPEETIIPTHPYWDVFPKLVRVSTSEWPQSIPLSIRGTIETPIFESSNTDVAEVDESGNIICGMQPGAAIVVAFGAPDVLRTCHFATTIVNSVLAS
jgi:hypothetical protein